MTYVPVRMHLGNEVYTLNKVSYLRISSTRINDLMNDANLENKSSFTELELIVNYKHLAFVSLSVSWS